MVKKYITRYFRRFYVYIFFIVAMLSFNNGVQGQLVADFFSNNTEVCSGSSVTFTSNSSGTSDATAYSWNFGAGANPATSSSAGPVTVTYSGSGLSTVTLEIVENGETQSEVKTDYIEVYELPTASIAGEEEVCQDFLPEPMITFTGENGTPPYTFTYRINDGGNQTITTSGGSSVSLPVSTASPGTYNYSLVSVRDDSDLQCLNLQTGNAVVTVYETPSANPGTGLTVCGLDYTLQAIPSVGTGSWSLSDGADAVVFTPDSEDPNALVTVPGYGDYSFIWTEVNGVCYDSASIDITFVNSPTANAGFDGDTCSDYFALAAEPADGLGYWSIADGPGYTVFYPSTNDPEVIIRVNEFGTYKYAWTVENELCGSSDTVTVIFRDPPEVNAGGDTVICIGNTIQLNATGNGVFSWTPDTLVSNQDIPDPMVSPEETSVFKVRVTDEFGCVNYDDLLVTVRKPPLADAGPDQELNHEFNTTLNALLENDFETGVWSLMAGSGDIADSLSPRTTVTDLSIGENKFMWTIRNEACPAVSDSLTVFVTDLIVPTLITPNNDGRNDFLLIKGIEKLGRTELVVFDKNGVVVYRTRDYNNEWNGVDNSGNQLPDDTYFFMINAENGRKISSFIVIRR